MKKPRLAQTMMIGTILLIAAFQAYWLVKLYKDELEALQKETDVIFRETVYKLQVARFKKDTLTFRRFSSDKIDDNLFNIEAINVLRKTSDTPKLRRPARIIVSTTHEDLAAEKLGLEELKIDTTLNGQRHLRIMSSGDEDRALKIFSSLKRQGDSSINLPDSIRVLHVRHPANILKLKSATAIPILNKKAKIQEPVAINKTIKQVELVKDNGGSSIRVFSRSKSLNDFLPIYQIDSAYNFELKRAAIKLRFSITKSAEKINSGPASKNTFKTNPASVGFLSPYYYQASFSNPFYFILIRIAPQIILSVLIVAFTISSFIVLYKNLVAQRRLADIKNEFISNITHELKTPIATVNVAIEAMKSFNAINNPERTKEYLDISASELQRLSLLVDKVLKLSMFENKEVELKKEWFNVVDLINEILVSMKLQFEKQKATILLEKTGENFTIHADRMHITSVIYNLLDNALKYSQQQTNIIVQINSFPQYLELRISDNGIGIPEEYQIKIFDKFFRVPSGDKHNIKGYGLGLSYVSHILKKHHGFIEVESDLHKGSTFIVKLPYEEAPVINYDNNRRITKRKLL